jgi:hypothetical protein
MVNIFYIDSPLYRHIKVLTVYKKNEEVVVDKR